MRGTRSAFMAMFGLVAAVQPARCSCEARVGGDGTTTATEERAVALPLPGKTCDREVPGTEGTWTLESSGAGRGAQPSAPRTLDRLCVYRWLSRSPGARPDLDAFDPAAFADASIERPVVLALANASADQARILTDARRKLDLQAEAATAALPPPVKRVLVGFPDTSPEAHPPDADTIPVGSGNPHGFNLAWLNRHLTCPNGTAGSCLTSPRTALALATNGRGTRRTLAQGIRSIVDDWAGRGGPRERGQPLVLTIAAGWEPAYECSLRAPRPAAASYERYMLPFEKGDGKGPRPAAAKGDVTVSVDAQPFAEAQLIPLASSTVECLATPMLLSAEGQAVLDEIRLAACLGALVVASAGNNPLTTPPRKGPMIPAAWEMSAAPDAAVCGQILAGAGLSSPAAPPASAPATTYRPLLYAATGVNEDDMPIVLTRAGGNARLAAPGSLLAAYPTDRAWGGYASECGLTSATGSATTTSSATTSGPLCDRSYPMTGSSVAAAVVSAAAAAAWAYNPTWDPHQIMSLVHKNGAHLTVQPDFLFGGSALPAADTQVSRVSVCRAAAASYALSSPGAPPIACRDDQSTHAYNDGPVRTPPYVALPGFVPFDATLVGSPVDPQPTWPCPPCRARLPDPLVDYWEITGDIPSDAWSALGASDLRVFDGNPAPRETGSPQVLLQGARGNQLNVSASGFLATTTASPQNGDDATWESSTSTLPVRGFFRTPSSSDLAHVVVVFQQRASATGQWSSAAQEIYLDPPGP